ncbi:MAG: ABC transporter ATP-binding protein [Phormidesmis sp.]
MAKVVLENITKIFPGSGKAASGSSSSAPAPAKTDQRVLRHINLTVEDGEFMVLVGPSGCGKSTLLRLISGLETLTSGDIRVGDRCVNTLPPKQRDIAMVFQSYALYPHLSVYDNLAFGLRRTRHAAKKSAQESASASNHRPPWIDSFLVGLTRPFPQPLRYRSSAERQIADRVHSVAHMLQIEELLTRLPKQLSGGQKQRVALGRAMARNPQVFLMDEPLSNLDAKLRTETRAQIVSLQHQLKTTTIYVTHDQTEAMTMGDRIAVMKQGEIQQVAPPLELYRYPANRFVAAFIGSPPMNFLRVTVKAAQLVHPAFTVALPTQWHSRLAPYQNQSLVLGIRPEHIDVGQRPGSVATTVTQLEALGSETFVVADVVSPIAAEPETKQDTQLDTEPNAALLTHQTRLQIRISAEQFAEIGSILHLSFPANKIHLFDPATDSALRP